MARESTHTDTRRMGRDLLLCTNTGVSIVPRLLPQRAKGCMGGGKAPWPNSRGVVYFPTALNSPRRPSALGF